jgi:biotin carboxylase
MKCDNKKLLIAGGSYADLPLIKAAKKMGYYVVTSGNRPDELGHKESDEYCAADFSIPEVMLELAKKLNIDAICPCSNDFSAISSAYVAENLGLPGHDSYETSKLLHHKDSYRAFALSNNIPTPKAEGFTDIDSALSAIKNFQLPVMVKPVDLTGGKGISKINNLSEAKQALQNAFAISKSKRIVVEEFITGSRHGFSTFIRKGKVVFHFSDNEHYYLNPYMVSAASTPTMVLPKVIDILLYQVEKIASLLLLKTGIFHVQYILHGSNEPIIIEICRRSPGDLYTQFIEIATGVFYSDWIVKTFAGFDCNGLSHVEPKGFFTRYCVMASKNGIVKTVNISDSIKNNIYDEFFLWKKGDIIDNYLVQKLGIVMLRYDSMDEMMEKTNKLTALIRVEVE